MYDFKGTQQISSDPTSLRRMGRTEATKRILVQQLQNRRSWSNGGKVPYIQFMVALKDGLVIKILMSTMENRLTNTKVKPRRNHHLEKQKISVGKARRNNIALFTIREWPADLPCLNKASRALM